LFLRRISLRPLVGLKSAIILTCANLFCLVFETGSPHMTHAGLQPHPAQGVFLFSVLEKQGMVLHICNSSTGEAEAGGFWVQVSLGYIVRHYLKCFLNIW
jgi:hypothetical protein